MPEDNKGNIDFTVYGFDAQPRGNDCEPSPEKEADTAESVFEDNTEFYDTEISEEETEDVSDAVLEDPEISSYPIIIQKPKGKRKNKILAAAMAACVLLSFGAGFGGNYLANYLNSNSGTSSTGSTKVVYQSVERTDQNGDTAKDLSVADIAAIAADSVVEITTETVTTGSRLGQYVSEGAGSGVVVTTDGYIVTNNHVIEGATKIKVRLRNGTEYDATLVGTDTTTDIAVVKIVATGLQPAVLGTSANLKVGETAVAIGNPLGELGGTVTNGIISALDRQITIDGETMTLLQTNAEINPGNSGGGLFNSSGELIGIVNAKSSGSDVEGLGFAIPIDTAKPVIEALIENGYVKGRIDLGLELVDVSDASTAMMYRVSRTGVYVSAVTNSALDFEAGDYIYSIDGKEITSTSDITTLLSTHKVGDTLSVVIIRSTKQMTVSLKLSEYVPSSTSSSSSDSTNGSTT